MALKELHYKKTEEFFNKVGQERRGYFDSSKSIAYFFQEKIKKKSLKLVKDYQPKRILDVACGRGDFSATLAYFFRKAEIEGIDFSLEMINVAKKFYGDIKNLEFSQTNALHLPFKNKSFDITFFLDTFHIIHKDDFQRIIDELCRVTRQAIILDFRNKRTIFWKIYQYFFKRANPQINCYGITEDEISKLFNKNGFLKEKISPLFKFKIFSPVVLAKFLAENSFLFTFLTFYSMKFRSLLEKFLEA